MTAVDEIGRSKYVSLTTFRKDGTPVATPVWHVLDAGEVFVVTGADSWKVKRIRNNSHVVVTVCSVRGKVAPGAASVEGTAVIQDDAGTRSSRALLARKYVLSRLGNWFSRALHLRQAPLVGIAITL